jgi:low temperature requirement protein LtrA
VSAVLERKLPWGTDCVVRCRIGIKPNNDCTNLTTAHEPQIANFADELAKDPTGINLVVFILIFTPAWHAWADAKENANNYYNDDLLQRASILWVMSLLILYGNNANYVKEDLWAQRATVGAYMCIRFTQISFFFMYSIASHHHRVQNRIYAGLTFIGLFIWIPIYFEEVSDTAKIAVAAVAIFWEELSYVLGFTPLIPKRLGLEYTTAVDIGHENDRYTAFTIIVLGEFTYVVVVGYV